MARRLGLGLLALLAGVLAVVVITFGLVQTAPGQQLLARGLQAALSADGAAAQIEGIGGFVPVDMSLERLRLRDRDGAWLTIDGARIAWSPTALLRGRLHIEELRAARIELRRLPPAAEAAEDEAPAEPFALPELPTSLPPVSVARLAVDELALGAPVLGEPATFRVGGRLVVAEDGAGANLDLDVERTDRAAASLALDAELGLDPPALDLSLAASESGGLLAAASGRADAGDFTLRLVGSGPLDAWHGALQADAQGLARLEAELELAATEQPRLAVDGALRPAPGLLPAEVAPLIDEHLDLELTVVRSAAQRLRIERLRATTSALALTAGGRLDLAEDEIDLEAALDLERLAALERLAGTPLAGHLTLEATAEGPLLRPRGEATLAIANLEAAAITAGNIETRLDYAALEDLGAALAVRVRAEGEASGVAFGADVPLPAQNVAWEFDIRAPAAGDIAIETARITTDQLSLTAAGALDRGSLAGGVTLRLEADNLGALTEGLGQRVDGRLALTADTTLAPQMERIEVALSGALEDLAGLPAGAAELLGARVELAAAATVEPERRVSVSNLAIDGAHVSLGGDLAMTLPGQALDGKLSATVARLEVLRPVAEPSLAGALSVVSELRGALDAPALTLEARAQDAVLADRAFEQLVLRITGEDLLGAPRGDVRLVAETAEIEAGLSSRYRLEGETLALDDLALEVPGTQAEGALAVDLARTLVDGGLSGRIADLARLRPLLPVAASGELAFELGLRPEDGAQVAALSLDGSELGSEFGDLRELALEATLADVFGEPRVSANARVDDLQTEGARLDRADLQVRGTLDEITLSAALEGEATATFALDTTAVVSLGEALRVRLEQLEGEVADQPLRLEQPARVTIDGPALELDGLDLAYAGARLSAGLALGPQEVAGEATLEGLPLAALERFGAPPLGGRAGARLSLNGAADDPSAELELSVDELRAADPTLADLPPLQVSASAQLAGRRLDATLEASGVTAEPVTVRLGAPMVVNLQSFVFELPADGALTGQLDGRIQLARVADLLVLDDQRLGGELSTSLALAGTIAEPTVDGTLEISDGLYENGATGTVLREITLKARADRQRITIDQLSATDGNKGRVRGEGTITLAPADDFGVDARLTMDDAHLLRREDLSATVSGALALAGDADRATLDGEIAIDRAEIGIPEGGGPDIAVLDVQEIGGDRLSEPQDGQADGSDGFELLLDVTVDIPGQVFVRGRGLESEWQGELQVTGSASSPRITGGLQVRRGHFDFIDQRFELRRGEIGFAGASPPEPTIDVEAVAEAEDITAIVRLSGSAGEPKLALDSEPPLPQDEVLSRLLFDREVSEISAAEAASLAIAVNRLRGGGGFDLLGSTRDLLRLDTLDVGGDSIEEGTVRAGKYVGDDVYLELEKGTAEESGKARVEVEILPNLSLEAETGEDQQSGVGIKWKFDY